MFEILGTCGCEKAELRDSTVPVLDVCASDNGLILNISLAIDD